MGEETLAHNWQFAVRFKGQGCRLRRLTTAQPPRLSNIRSPACALSGSHNHTVLLTESATCTTYDKRHI